MTIYDVFYMFRTRGFIFRKTVVCTGMVYYVLHASVSAVLYGLNKHKERGSQTDCEVPYSLCRSTLNIHVYKTSTLKKNAQVGNM